ncbi:hypothetical protein [Archangium lansingense]|uniref:Uncharacterized protein n=1 Tax=Archangium lansingense TaxID=2995310 RepID=A0ABT4AQV3_9BACT|nr:hypothetical protein [Archangium lansinium]MCY1083646.1 hypothetical protein [Archangium lansinium]
MEKVIQTFEGLIRRSLAPSVTFFFVLALGELIRVKLNGELARDHVERFLKFMTSEPLAKSPAILLTLAILAIIGLSYGLQAVQQVAFDNWLKENFHQPRWLSRLARFKWLGWLETSDSKALVELRNRVVQRINDQEQRFTELSPGLKELKDLKEVSDYILYEIIGGIDPTDTRSFVDSAKAVGIFFVSVIIVLVGNAWVYHHWLSWRGTLLLVGLVIFFYCMGLEAIRTQYRARALRLYVNFLAMPPQRIHRLLSRPDEGKAPSSEEKKKES